MLNKTILLTGSTGFIGRNISNRLKKEGANLIELDSKNDLRIKNSLADWNGKVDYVVHAAGKVFVPDSWTDPLSFLEVNTEGTLNVMEFCRINRIGCTYISGYVYGKNTPLPILENAMIEPSNPYAYSKYLGEMACKMFHDCFQVPVQIIRPFNVYGSGQSEKFLIPMLVKQFSESSKVQVKDLKPRRDFIHMEDLADMILLTCFRNDFNIFNAGTGRSISVAGLIETMKEITGKNPEIINENIQRENEIDDSFADISNAKKILDWSPKIDIKQGLRKLF